VPDTRLLARLAREKSNERKAELAETIQADLGSPVLARKTFRFAPTPNHPHVRRVPPRSEGRIAIVNERWVRDAVDAMMP
jgi:hypothetical protein